MITLACMTAKADEISINSVADLQNLATAVKEGNSNFEGDVIRLTTDLDLDEIDWMPIGTLDNPFCGTFDGQGHWISNLSVDVDGNETGDVAGFFGYIGAAGTVRKLGIESGSVHISQKSDPDRNCYVGGIAGLNEGCIEQCANRATIVGNWTMAHVGGIAGANGIIGGGSTSALIRNCYNQGRIFTTATDAFSGNYLGGIVGDTDGKVWRVYNYAEVSEAFHSGQIYGDSSNDEGISNAYANGEAMRGSALDGSLNTAGNYRIWTFADNELPKLAWLTWPSITLYNDADNAATLEAYDGQTCNVTLVGRTLYKDGAWNTISLPFDLPTLEETPLEDATSKILADASFNDHTLTLNFYDVDLIIWANNEIPASFPLLVKWTSGSDIINPAFGGVTINKTLTPFPCPYAGTPILTYTGNFSPVTLAANDRQKLYLGSDNKLYYPAADITVGSFRAYFILDDSLFAGEPASEDAIRSFVLHFGEREDVTNVEQPTLQHPQHTSDWYTLDGRKLSQKPTTAGIYVNKGKRIAVSF